MLHQFRLAFEGHSTGIALEAGFCLLLLGRPHMHFPVLQKLALGVELGSARVTGVLLSETECQLLIAKQGSCELFGHLFGASNRLFDRLLVLGPLWLWFFIVAGRKINSVNRFALCKDVYLTGSDSRQH
jgi:hypothetical protein